jgi:hypothetical protein
MVLEEKKSDVFHDRSQFNHAQASLAECRWLRSRGGDYAS